MPHRPADPQLIDSRYAAWRLLTTLGLVTLGNSSMYVVAVVLPAVQAEFGVNRADASLPYTLMMICLGLGGLWTGKWADRYGITRVLLLGSVAVCGGFVWAGLSGSCRSPAPNACRACNTLPPRCCRSCPAPMQARSSA